MPQDDSPTQPLVLSTAERVAEQTRIRKALLRGGYVPLANRNKMCVLEGWPSLPVDEAVVEGWADQRRYVATGVRVDGPLLVLDFDIDDAEMLDAIWAALPAELARLLDAAPMRFGGGEKFALFLRCAEKVGYLISQGYAPPGSERLMRVEVFGSGHARQIGAYGVHSHDDEGGVAREYSWAGGWGLADVPLAGLPEITVEQVKAVLDVASVAMREAGWQYEVETRAGAVVSGPVFDIEDGLVFETQDHGEVVGIAALEALCSVDGPGVRLSASWLEGSRAVNRARCIARLNAGDDRLQIWESAGCVLHRPVDMDIGRKIARLSERLAGSVGGAGADGGGGAAYGDGGDGGGVSRLDALLAAVPAERRLFQESGVAEGGSSVDVDNRGKVALQLAEGDMHNVAEDTVAVLRARHTRLFDMGGLPVVVDEDMKVRQARGDRLAHEMQRVMDFVVVKKTAKATTVTPVEPPKALVGRIEALSYRLPALRAVVDMPVLRRSGEMIGEGYDETSGLLVLSEAAGEGAVVPNVVDDASARVALSALWKPFSRFPFADRTDKGGALAAVLTAVLRPVLPTAPMFVFDAPTQGSGKTLLSMAVGALAGGAQLMAPLPSKDEAEVRKVLLSVLLESPRAVVFDNQWGMLDSAVLAGMLTSEVFGGRLLGTNTNLKAPTSVLVMVTGNNVILGGETPRRSVRVRIDAGMDAPFTRSFDFCPHAYVREHRAALVGAALTLVRWALHGAGRGRIGSFEMWDEMVGQTVAKVCCVLDEGFADPAESIKTAHADDPRRDELDEVLTALRDEFGNKWFTGAEVAARLTASGGASAHPLMDALSLDKPPSSKTVGRVLTYRRDAVVNGLRLQVGRDNKAKLNRFRVWSDDDVADVVVEGALELRRKEQRSRLTAISNPAAGNSGGV
jgi:hypothetical protein